MAVQEISAKSGKLADRVITVKYDLGKDLDEAIAKFGKEAIHSNFCDSAIITIQSGMRNMAVKGKTDAEIQAVFDQWKPGTVRVRGAVDPVAGLIAKFPTLDPAKQDELLRKLKELQAAKKK